MNLLKYYWFIVEYFLRMNDNEASLFLHLLWSVDKEERELERVADEDRQCLSHVQFIELTITLRIVESK